MIYMSDSSDSQDKLDNLHIHQIIFLSKMIAFFSNKRISVLVWSHMQ